LVPGSRGFAVGVTHHNGPITGERAAFFAANRAGASVIDQNIGGGDD
jgi:hypothetical protein